MKKKLRIILINLVTTLFILLAIEASIEALLRNPSLILSKLQSIFRVYYDHNDVKVIQFSPDYATYDKDLFYKLKPGKFVFSNREFSNSFYVNSFGLRDDEKSLIKPEIIVLGDSYSMGWGVEQDSSYANLIETQTGLKVLNTGISSYGTAREFLILNKTDTDSLKHLIIQYCRNDYFENKEFFQHDSLPISSETLYNENCASEKRKSKYFIFKHLYYCSKTLGQQLARKIRTKTGDKNELPKAELNPQEAFLKVVAKMASIIPKNTQITIFTLPAGKNEKVFFDGLKKQLNEDRFSSFRQRIRLLNMTEHLKKKHYFILDCHLNAKGHRVLSERIVSAIQTE